jgi:glucan phosphoethanolaminetransferase (alkaline phosphatase superfamily)
MPLSNSSAPWAASAWINTKYYDSANVEGGKRALNLFVVILGQVVMEDQNELNNFHVEDNDFTSNLSFPLFEATRFSACTPATSDGVR